MLVDPSFGIIAGIFQKVSFECPKTYFLLVYSMVIQRENYLFIYGLLLKTFFLVYSMVSEHSEKENHIYLLRIDKSCVNGPCSIAMLNNERVATRWFLNMLDR